MYLFIVLFSIFCGSVLPASFFYYVLWDWYQKNSRLGFTILVLLYIFGGSLGIFADTFIYSSYPDLRMNRNVQSYIFETSQGFGTLFFWIPLAFILTLIDRLKDKNSSKKVPAARWTKLIFKLYLIIEMSFLGLQICFAAISSYPIDLEQIGFFLRRNLLFILVAPSLISYLYDNTKVKQLLFSALFILLPLLLIPLGPTKYFYPPGYLALLFVLPSIINLNYQRYKKNKIPS